MKILLTGAHFSPAVAVCEELKKEKGVNLVYVGRNSTFEGQNVRSLESIVFPSLGVRFIALFAGRLDRFISVNSVISLLKIPVGFIQAFFIILKEKPDVTLSFGGYIGLPVVICSWFWSIPIIIHEQGLQMGLANKISSYFADKIAISFKETKVISNQKTIVTGNPQRREILNPEKLTSDYEKFFSDAKRNKKPVIFVTGGNQGSHVINKCIENSLNTLLKNFYLIHQTGQSSFGDFDRLLKLQNKSYQVKKWIDREMGTIIKFSDLVICRAGINTLSELAFLEKPTLVIPIPFQKEQINNAKFFEKLGTVSVLPQSELSGKNLIALSKKILIEKLQFEKNCRQTKSIFIKDASKRLALEVLLLAG